MPRLSALCALLTILALTGCDRGARTAPGLIEAPNLGGAVLDEAGVARTPVRIEGILHVGETVDGALPTQGELFGWEFEAFQGAELTAQFASGAAGGVARVSIYGPRTSTGLWDAAVDTISGPLPGELTLEARTLSRPGMYLILVQANPGARDGEYSLGLACRGNCGTATCPELSPCERVCALGFRVDAEGCRVCECRSAEACSDEVPCPNGQVCGADARCVEAPPPPECESRAEVCADDGRTWPNRCRAEQAGLTVVSEGPCPVVPDAQCDAMRPCAAPARCVEGRCEQVECRCGDEVEPVCSVSHQTYVNACRLVCAEGERALAYEGACLAMQPCRDDRACPDGTRCAPVREPANLERCAEDPFDPRCEQVCLPEERREPCGRGLEPCDDGEACYALGSSPGVCVATCILDQGECGEGARCADVADDDGRGLCLAPCEPGGLPGCGRGSFCRADRAGVNFCQACDCPMPEPGEEVCTDQAVTYPSECLARCAQAQNFRPGRCDRDAVCECPPTYAAVCAEGRVFDRCEADCLLPEGEGEAVESVAECLGLDEVDVACRVDADCVRTGCGDRFCLGEDVGEAACAELSPVSQCFARAGRCGCVNNRCGFASTPEALRCIDQLEAGGPPPPSPRSPPR